MAKSGVYRIKNLETGAMYIGQTSLSFAKRWGQHRRSLEGGYHKNTHLQNSYNKHGKGAFEYKIIEVIPQGDMTDQEFLAYMNEREIVLISEHDTLENGYNKTEGGGGTMGHDVSEVTKAKISAANKGKKLTDEHKAKLSAARRGRKLSPEQKAKISKANRCRKASAETRAKISAARMGRKHTLVAREKMSKAQIGKRASEETRAKLSKMRKGKPWSATRRARFEARNHKGEGK